MKESVVVRGEEPLCALYRQYGYMPYKMSKFEEYELYVKNKSFLLSENIITFTENGKLMALKPDVTLSIVKGAKDLPGVEKVYYKESVYRVPKGDASFRESTQIGLEYLGSVDRYATCEVLSLAAKSLAMLSEDWYLEISHLGLLSALVDAMGVSPAAKERVLCMVGEKNFHGICAVVAEEGGDPAVAEGLGELLLASSSPTEAVARMREILGETAELAELSAVLNALCATAAGDRVKWDLSVVNDMRYYSGIVFKGYVSGVPSAVLSGGRYDNLMRKMKKKADAIGFALYPELLENLPREREEYDVDTLLLYAPSDPEEAVLQAVECLVAKGERVLAAKEPSSELRARRTVSWKEVACRG